MVLIKIFSDNKFTTKAFFLRGLYMAKAKEIQHSEILRLEAEMNNLWGELNTCNIPHSTRMDMESKLTGCEEQFKVVLGGGASLRELETNLEICNQALAFATIQQAENELPKSERSMGCFQALENVRHELTAGHITPVRARHEVKGIMRHHS